MRIAALGGGPAGLFCSLLLKKTDPEREVTVIERNPADATYGFGVVFSDRTLTSFREADYKTSIAIEDDFVRWDSIDVRLRDATVRCGGQVFSAISRKRLLEILQGRCRELGVELRFDTEVDNPSAFEDHDLVLAADGVNSAVRSAHAEAFGPKLREGSSKFAWFGTELLLDAFTFIFRENRHGLFQVHAYPFDGATGTFIVECAEESWRNAGLDQADEADSLAYCEELFADDLGGRRLLSNRSQWLNFPTLRNSSWRHGRFVLLGDSAHTAHFSIGSGTKLAMEDAIALAQAFEQHDDLGAALDGYESERKPRVERLQQAAEQSQSYFEGTQRYLALAPEQFAFNLLTRSGRVDYDTLRLQDQRFVVSVDRFVHWGTSASPLPVTPPAAFAPLDVGGLALSNRVVASSPPSEAARDGKPAHAHVEGLAGAAARGAALVMTEPVAVAAEGRVTPASVGIYLPEHAERWRRMVDELKSHGAAKLGVRLSHAGRRGAVAPRVRGLDRPLRAGAWKLVSAAPLPYAARGQLPKQMDRADMHRVRDFFTQAAGRAAEAGFDLLQLDMARGYLLASFLSPLTNVREDDYGGALDNRTRFPLEVLDAVRTAWPGERPLSVRLTATDWAKGGLRVGDAVAIARALREHGCDLIEVVAGQTTPAARPRYDPYYLTSYSDRIRNEAAVATVATGDIATVDDVSTIVAAGRADLCLLRPGG